MIEKIGNSRLIYKQVRLKEFDLSSSLSEINSFIEENPKLMRSNSLEYIYFFSPSSKINTDKTQIWVAVEVVGFCSNDLLEDFDLGTKDLDSSHVRLFPGPESLLIESFFELETSIREKNSFVDSWRVEINHKSENGTVLQFWE